MQETTFKNIMAKEEIAQNEQFLLLPQYFQLCLIVKLSFIEICSFFVLYVGKWEYSDLFYVKRMSPYTLQETY